ncbi:hypothetical protein [Methanoculleus chikugoensis]|uniref:DUF7544 domain-containing protein n=1 Tax=Methanoculleus chikugoensis TaxID=118126 RepID=UPI001FB50528|nr:hypothetical protein [Methanoculleus chikugoensis]
MAEDMYAFSRLDGAFQRTKSLLWPIRWGVWLRLALIALFVGGGVSLPNTSGYTFEEGDLPPGRRGVPSRYRAAYRGVYPHRACDRSHLVDHRNGDAVRLRRHAPDG